MVDVKCKREEGEKPVVCLGCGLDHRVRYIIQITDKLANNGMLTRKLSYCPSCTRWIAAAISGELR